MKTDLEGYLDCRKRAVQIILEPEKDSITKVVLCKLSNPEEYIIRLFHDGFFGSSVICTPQEIITLRDNITSFLDQHGGNDND